MRSEPTAPYGRPPLSVIPVPPLTDAGAVAAYRTQLGIYVAALGRSRGVGLAEYALCAAIDLMPIADASGALTREALHVSLALAFPVAWTPQALLAAIMTALGQPPGWWSAEADRLVVHGDPELCATRHADGRWTVVLRERGQEQVEAELAGDDDLVLYLGENALAEHRPYPFGFSTTGHAVDALAAAAESARAAFDRHAELPYLAAWRDA